VKNDKGIIATARINIGGIDKFPPKEADFLSLTMFHNSYLNSTKHPFAYITKLMIAPEYRSSHVLYLIMTKCYEICYNEHVHFMFGACNFHLLRLYEQIGFHRYGKNFVYPGYGLLTPIVLALNDIQHFREVRSPYVRIVRKITDLETNSVEWFRKAFLEHSTVINSRQITEDYLWNILSKKLNCLPLEAMTVLNNLSQSEAKKFLHSCASHVICEPGDVIIHQGDISYAYNILLSGTLKSSTFINPIKEYAVPGMAFGANGLTEHNKDYEEIAAISQAEILVLTGSAFQRFYHTNPETAHKIVQNIRSLT
jgi:predicted GNAT family N-acyltransferase